MKRMPKKISQSEIARQLGVSQSLVSIVLNGRREGIAEKTYERIWEYALEHGYSPKGMKMPEGAGSPDNGVKAVGYFLRAPLRLANKSNFFSHVAQGLHDYLRERQVNLVFLGSELDFQPRDLHKAWQGKFLEGIVVMGQVQADFLASVRALDKPLVYVSARSPGMCHSVNANEYQSAEQLVDHLHGLGHRHFAYLGALCAPGRHQERLEALKLALQRHQLELPDGAILTDIEGERKEGYQLAERLLQAPLAPRPTAIVCVNGLLARGVISRLFQEGLRPGEDLSVVAFDNTRVCSEEVPGITSASAIPEDLGREAGRIVLSPDLHSGDSLLDLVLPSRFFERSSSGAVSKQASLPKSALR